MREDRIDSAKASPRYSAIESLYVKTEASITGYPGYTRQTWVTRTGGGVTDTTDFKTVTVQVSNAQAGTTVRKTTVIAPF